MVKPEQPKQARPAGDAPVPPQATLTSTELMQGRRVIVIVHQGETYRLQQTRNGKLILTK
ncbi:MAG: hemin uptake protein HemP [Rhodocyclales bacterium]|nr:hemin uptake protein HemP [Rhodocyclales bacterium]